MTTMNKMVLNGTREDHKSALYPFFFYYINWSLYSVLCYKMYINSHPIRGLQQATGPLWWSFPMPNFN